MQERPQVELIDPMSPYFSDAEIHSLWRTIGCLCFSGGAGAMSKRCSVWLVMILIGGAPTDLMSQDIGPDVMYAHFIDVGQGDATLLEFSCGAVLIDAGGQDPITSDRLIGYLDNFFDRRPDLNQTISTIIVTHNHTDHTSTLRRVIEEFTVETVVENGQRGSSRDPGDTPLRWMMRRISQGQFSVALVQIDDSEIVEDIGLITPEIDPVDCAGTDPIISIVSADLAENPGWAQRSFRNKNNHSLVVRVEFGHATFLFTGDLQAPAIETMVEYYDGVPTLDVDVYQVGHHGSHNATTETLLETMVDLEIAVISMGACDNRRGNWTGYRYGHPRADIVSMLSDAIDRRRSTPKDVYIAEGTRDFRRIEMRDAIYATGWDGTVRIRATASGRYRVDLVNQRTTPTTC